jgi:Sulfotransferase domain
VEPPVTAKTGSARGPDFFIVGQPKSGSTALYEMLSQHPSIFMPALKEPDFFATDLRHRFPPRIGGTTPTDLASYLALFRDARPDQLAGEASILYLRSHEAAAGIAAFNPRARIVAILREPAQLLRSLHLQLLQTHVESVRDLRTALLLEDERRRGLRIPRHCHRPQLLQYSEQVRYVDQLERFHASFPAEQILVFAYEDFREDNQAVVRSIFEFLGVDPGHRVEPSSANPTRLLRSQLADDALHRVSVGRGRASRAFKAGLKAVTPEAARRRLLRRAYGRLYAPPPPVDEETMAYIRATYAGEVERLSTYLGRDFLELWGYSPTRSSAG